MEHKVPQVPLHTWPFTCAASVFSCNLCLLGCKSSAPEVYLKVTLCAFSIAISFPIYVDLSIRFVFAFAFQCIHSADVVIQSKRKSVAEPTFPVAVGSRSRTLHARVHAGTHNPVSYTRSRPLFRDNRFLLPLALSPANVWWDITGCHSVFLHYESLKLPLTFFF